MSRRYKNRIWGLLVLVGISTPSLFAQIHWKHVTDRPVLDFGETGDWDAAFVTCPAVIKDGDTLRMWYTGRDIMGSNYKQSIGYAWSLDGVEWTRYKHNPVLIATLPWEEGQVHSCAVLQDGDTLRMWYLGNSRFSGDVGYATSLDGLRWHKHPNTVLYLGPPGDWDSGFLVPRTVIKEDGLYDMWYWGGQGPAATATCQTGLAVSTDGINWVKYDNSLTVEPPFAISDPVLKGSDSPAWDDKSAYRSFVLRTDAGYEMFYSGRGGRALNDEFIGYATSSDGISWTKYRKNPVVDKYPSWANGITWPVVLRYDGKYHLWFGGYNNIGYGTRIGYMISPPWWHTSWAYILFFTLGSIVLFGIIFSSGRTVSARAIINKELEMQNFEVERLQELDKLKSHFFTNISHEFRTPLTLILGPLEILATKVKDVSAIHDINTIQRNAKRLLRLINQLLDISRIESGSITLQTRPENIGARVHRIVQSFEALAEIKHITLRFDVPTERIIVYIDREILEEILSNLLSNALKFTPEGGRVDVSLSCVYPGFNTEIGRAFPEHLDNSYVEINVRDTGNGIHADKLDKIFDRFYQVAGGHIHEQKGAGIGLAIAKELVELQKGDISVNSELGKGSQFTVRLPLGKDHLNESEIVEEPIRPDMVEPVPVALEADVSIQPGQATEKKTTDAPGRDAPLVLIVEDNADMRWYLRDGLERSYRIMEAKDGTEGLEQALEKMPDLIISDVMMPGVDGFELSEKLKTDERTSHIPVILLTAKAGMENKLRGLETGADDYINKPLDMRELQTKAGNLIDQRCILRKRYRWEATLNPSRAVTVTSIDEQFLKRALDVIEVHMSDEKFSAAELAREVGMSRTNLHYKLRALTDQSTGEFIRTQRLYRAAQLLKQTHDTVTRIAYAVGFSNPSYFTACFKKQFGQLPSGYLR